MSRLKSVWHELLAQHGALRELIAHCDELADELERGRVEPVVLLHGVERLRAAFEAHNRYEEQFLRPILAEAGHGHVDIAIAAHVAIHRRAREGLGSTITAELRQTLDEIRDHLDGEESELSAFRVHEPEP